LGVQVPPRLPISDNAAIGSEAMQLNPVVLYNDTRRFAIEVRTEFRKVTWPTQKEAIGGTIGVIVIVAIITSVLSIVDVVLGQLIQLALP
jgi:preprotein translocase subunit SecE